MKMFLVEILLNLLIYVINNNNNNNNNNNLSHLYCAIININFFFAYIRNMHSKNTEAPLPVYYYIYIVPNDTRIYGMLKVFHTISFNFYSSMFQQYCTRMNKEKFQTGHKNKNKLRTMSFGKIY